MKQYPVLIVIIFLFILLLLTTPAGAYPEVGPGTFMNGVSIFPPDDIWNVAVDQLPVDPHSAGYVSKIGAGTSLHPDFGSGLWDGHKIGIPFNIVTGSVAKTTVTFYYPGESDPGPYPIPPNPATEGGTDRHILLLNQDENVLYELYDASQQTDGSWHAGSGAIFNLDGYALRPAGWTSADAAGLPILPGLVRYDEVSTGDITHAIRFTAPSTQRAYVWPARHYASAIMDPTYPPMGERFRLKSSFDTSGYPYQARVILDALKKYGMVLADNGGAWFISGAPDERWDNEALHTLSQLKGSDFEAVDTSSLMINQDSSQARTSSQPVPAGSIDIESTPAGASVFLDNIYVGISPLILTNITPGSHTIRCSLTGYYDNSTEVPVTPLQYVIVNLDLASSEASIKLEEGWNFVSVPVLHPQSPYPDLQYYSLFLDIDNAGHSSWRYHADTRNWEILYPNSTLSPLDGIWIYAATAKTIPVPGDNTLAPAHKHLYTGWNSIGYAGPAKPASGALTSLSGKWIMLFDFNSDSKQYDPTIFINDPSENTPLTPGKGYWVYMDDIAEYSLSSAP